jgi:hypothetical protein
MQPTSLAIISLPPQSLTDSQPRHLRTSTSTLEIDTPPDEVKKVFQLETKFELTLYMMKGTGDGS